MANRMKMDYKPVSLADQVYERLESEILSGKYPRGEIVTELRLCSELGVSRTPIREALRRLEQLHLIEDTPRGTMILGITGKDFADISAIRQRIEGLAVRSFIENMTDESLKLLTDAVELQEYYLNKSDPDHIRAQDTLFHTIIYEYCGSAILCDTLLPLHKKVQKFRKISIEEPSRAITSVQEHRAIADAIAERNADLAEELMFQHVANALHTIIEKGM